MIVRVEQRDWVVAGKRSGSSLEISAQCDGNDSVEEKLNCRRITGKS